MSKLIKLALIVAIAGVAIAAKQVTSPGTDHAGYGPSAAISPTEITNGVGLLTETPVDNVFLISGETTSAK